MVNPFVEHTDAQLLLALRNNEYMAFNALYERYWPVVYSSAYKRLQDSATAKDITQDIFLQIWNRRNELDIVHLPSYLYTSVKNNVLKWMAKEERYKPIPELLEKWESKRHHPDEGLLYKEFLAVYEKLINQLPPAQREIYLLRYQQDMTTLEIARKLNISRKTVQNQLGKSTSFLRDSLSLYLILNVLLTQSS